MNFLGSGKKFTKSRGFTKSSVTNSLSSEIDIFVKMDTIGLYNHLFIYSSTLSHLMPFTQALLTSNLIAAADGFMESSIN